jgi:hypothetical protein
MRLLIEEAREYAITRDWWDDWHHSSTGAIPRGCHKRPWPYLDDDREVLATLTADSVYYELRRIAESISTNYALMELHLVEDQVKREAFLHQIHSTFE